MIRTFAEFEKSLRKPSCASRWRLYWDIGNVTLERCTAVCSAEYCSVVRSSVRDKGNPGHSGPTCPSFKQPRCRQRAQCGRTTHASRIAVHFTQASTILSTSVSKISRSLRLCSPSGTPSVDADEVGHQGGRAPTALDRELMLPTCRRYLVCRQQLCPWFSRPNARSSRSNLRRFVVSPSGSETTFSALHNISIAGCPRSGVRPQTKR